MAEDHISRDEHRDDMAELRSELKEEIAGLRQEITVLTKTMEANQQTMSLRFEQADQRHSDLLAMMNQRFDQVEQQRQEDRQVMLQQFQQADQRHSDPVTAMNQRFAQHKTRLGSMENWMRTTFVAVAAVGVAAQLFYTLMRFGLKPPTGP